MYGNGISQRRYQTQLDPEHLLLFDYQLIEIQCHTDPPCTAFKQVHKPSLLQRAAMEQSLLCLPENYANEN